MSHACQEGAQKAVRKAPYLLLEENQQLDSDTFCWSVFAV